MARTSKEPVKQRGDSWYCNFTDRHTGERIRAALNTIDKSVALQRVLEWQQWCEDCHTSRRLNRPLPARPTERDVIEKSGMTVGELFDWYYNDHLAALPGGLSAKARFDALRKLEIEWRQGPVSVADLVIDKDMTEEVWQAVVEVRSQKAGKKKGTLVSPNTVNAEIVMVTAALNWARRVKKQKWVPHLDFSRRGGVKVKPRQYEQPVLSTIEIKRLRLALDSCCRQLFDFALLAGFRLNNCILLRKEQIDWEGNKQAPHGLVRIRQKGGYTHEFPLEPHSRRVLQEACLQTDDGFPNVFSYLPERSYHPRHAKFTAEFTGQDKGVRRAWTKSLFYARWYRATGRAVIEKPWHGLTRGGAITRWVHATGNLIRASKLAGHASVAMTARYVKTALSDKFEALVAANADVPWLETGTREGTNAAHEAVPKGKNSAASGD